MSDGTRIGERVSREQVVTMLYRYAGHPAVEDIPLNFQDASKVSTYARTAMQCAVVNGILQGKSGGILGPQGLATWAQVARMLENYVEAAG